VNSSLSGVFPPFLMFSASDAYAPKVKPATLAVTPTP
jgi:hypothetical protein